MNWFGLMTHAAGTEGCSTWFFATVISRRHGSVSCSMKRQTHRSVVGTRTTNLTAKSGRSCREPISYSVRAVGKQQRELGLHPHRTLGRHRHHRDSGGAAVADAFPREERRPKYGMPEQSKA